MGLSAPKNRTKISQDPNNTNWSKSTDRFGHKILTAQGWAPGDTLGIKNASHAEHYTIASSSHIRVLLRDDNMGLGAQRKSNNDQFGLDMYQGLLGRLNGKSDTDLQKEAAGRRDVRLAILSGQRYGSTRFVSGGFLVGEKVEKTLEDALSVIPETAVDITASEDILGSESKKRKWSEEGSTSDANSKSKSSRKKQKALIEGTDEEKSKKTKKEKRKKQQDEEAEALPADEPSQVTSDTPEASEKTERKRLKAERKAQRQAKRLKKEERRRKKASASTDPSSNDDTTDASTLQTASVPSVALGRNLVRQRYIQQKRRACMDQSALNEIFMIKAPT